MLLVMIFAAAIFAAVAPCAGISYVFLLPSSQWIPFCRMQLADGNEEEALIHPKRSVQTATITAPSAVHSLASDKGKPTPNPKSGALSRIQEPTFGGSEVGRKSGHRAVAH